MTVRRLWLVTLLVAALGACAGLTDLVRGYGKARSSALAAYDLAALDAVERGAVQFAAGDFGALDTDAMETHATPWRLAGAALVLADSARSGAPVNAATLEIVMRRFGFLYPETLGNWPRALAPPQRIGPLGLNTGVIARSVPRVEITAANLGCASCHAGVTYDPSGAPQPDRAWLGAPNTSLDLEAYVQAIYVAFRDVPPDAALAAVPQVFPDTTDAEMASLRSFVLPRVKARMARIAAAGNAPLPFVNGAPGLTNGVAALKMQLGLLPADAHASQRGFTAIPDLADRGLRTSLLYDGAYRPPGAGQDRSMRRDDVTAAHLDGLAAVTAFFTVPSMGVHPDRARGYLDEARDLFRFLATYEPPRFPGVIDQAKARRGQALYAANCASCHGAYDDSLARPRLVSFPNRIAPYDTDPVRAAAFDSALAAGVNRSRYGDLIDARASGGYYGTILTGVWMSAPYLHNGSVPTLDALMTPARRPARFLVGGHRLDLAKVGIDLRPAANGDHVYPPGYAPFSTPALIDTAQPGLSRGGHESEFAPLSDAEKAALIEYLKLL